MPRETRPYRTPVTKAMPFPNNVVMEKLKTTGKRAILQTQGHQPHGAHSEVSQARYGI